MRATQPTGNHAANEIKTTHRPAIQADIKPNDGWQDHSADEPSNATSYTKMGRPTRHGNEKLYVQGKGKFHGKRKPAGVIFWSGKGAASLPLPPLRTGHDGFLSSGSSHCKAPLARSRFHDGFIPASWRWMPIRLKNARSSKYSRQRGSNGLASDLTFTYRRMRVSVGSTN